LNGKEEESEISAHEEREATPDAEWRNYTEE